MILHVACMCSWELHPANPDGADMDSVTVDLSVPSIEPAAVRPLLVMHHTQCTCILKLRSMWQARHSPAAEVQVAAASQRMFLYIV